MARQLLKLTLAVLLAALAGCPKSRPPATPAAPSFAGAVSPRDTAEFRLATSDPEGYSVSFRCSWGDGDTSGWSDWVGAGETATLRYAWQQVGRYDVTAQARDAQEVLSGWSEPVEVLVGNPPRRPTRPDGSRSGWMDTSYSYTTVATDIDADDIRYVFNWGDGAVETTAFQETGTYATLPYTWTSADTFAVTVRALDRPGLASAWSETLRVAIRDVDGPGVILWQYVHPDPESAAAVSGVPALDAQGRILYGDANGVMFCLDPDGSESWRYTAAGGIGGAVVVGDDGTVYAGAQDNRVYALSPAGVPRWTCDVGGAVNSTPALAGDGTVYVGSDDGRLHCISAGGTLRWSYATGGSISSSPAIAADGTIYFGSGDSFVYALGADSILKWRYATGDEVASSLAIGGDGTVYVTSRDGYLYALRPDGTLKWREVVGGRPMSSPVVGSDGNIYVGSDEGRLMSFYPVGGPVWQFGVVAGVDGPLLLDSDLVVYAAAGPRLYAVNSFGQGSVEWFLTLFGAGWAGATVTDDGVIYAGDSGGNLYAIRGSGKLDTGAWPKSHRDAGNTGRAGAR